MSKYISCILFNICIFTIPCVIAKEEPLIDSLQGAGLSAEHQALVDRINESHKNTLEKGSIHRLETYSYETSKISNEEIVAQVDDGPLLGFPKEKSRFEKMELVFLMRMVRNFEKASLFLHALASGESTETRHKRLEQEYVSAQDSTKQRLEQLCRSLEQHGSYITTEPQGLITQEKANAHKKMVQQSIENMTLSCSRPYAEKRSWKDYAYADCSDAIKRHIQDLRTLQEEQHLTDLREAPCIDSVVEHAAVYKICTEFMDKLDKQSRTLGSWDYRYPPQQDKVHSLQKGLDQQLSDLARKLDRLEREISTRCVQCLEEEIPSPLLQAALVCRRQWGPKSADEAFKKLVIACDGTTIKNDSIRKCVQEAQSDAKKLVVAEKELQDYNQTISSITTHNRQELVKLSECLYRKAQQDASLSPERATVLQDHAKNMYDGCRTKVESCDQNINDYLRLMKKAIPGDVKS